MDLLDFMTTGDDLRNKALDRLESILALYQSDEDEVQDEALTRAISLCGNEWGGYRQGLEYLAERVEKSATDPIAGELAALRLRDEADDPGAMIRAVRAQRSVAGRQAVERAAVVARYGNLEAARAPSPVERMFIDAARGLAVEGHDDPWAPLAGWEVPWHEVPAALAEAVGAACPLPAALIDARAEALSWEERKRERSILADGPGNAALPTACAARHNLVEEMWRRSLPARNGAEVEARLDYWATRAGDDGTGYAVVLADVRRLTAAGGWGEASSGTREKAKHLKRNNQEWSLARIGKELGISRQAVHKHLKK